MSRRRLVQPRTLQPVWEHCWISLQPEDQVGSQLYDVSDNQRGGLLDWQIIDVRRLDVRLVRKKT